MTYIRVVNWEKFQQYKDRRPPWIKLHMSLLEDYEFSCLHDASKLQAVLIWLLASRYENKVPADKEWLKRQLGVQADIDLESLVSAGFITMYQDDSKTLAGCKQNGCPETETETETEKTTTSVVATDLDLLRDRWNTMAGMCGLPCAKRVDTGGKRERTAKARLKDAEWVEQYPAALAKISTSAFLTGGSDRGWLANIDWFLRPETVTKIIEGAYDKGKGLGRLEVCKRKGDDDGNGESGF